jgi:hypothetical protein
MADKLVTPGGALDKLAKLLAAENIMVEHKPIKTAYFDVKNRVLALPMWKEMTETLYHMLVLHEVGHALETPAEAWKGAIDKVAEENSSRRVASTFQGYMNVVEDARIERKIKTKFPGSRRDFIEGYNWLHEQDFFGIKNEEIDGLSLIDRINLYFKLGTRLRIKFNEEEREFVRRAEQTITFDDVVKLAEDLLAYSKLKKENEEEEEQEFRMKGSTDEDGEEGDDFDDEDSDDSDSDDSESGEQDGEDEDDEEGKDLRGSSGKEGGSSSKPLKGPEEAKTDRAMNDRMEELLDQSVSGREFRYIHFPKDLTHEEFTIGYRQVIAQIDKDFGKAGNKQKLVDYRNWLLTRFRSENHAAINYMVKEFEMKKAAIAYSRSKQAKTGVIDVNKLHSYKFNDDIFKRLTIEPTGKNHGVVVILDMSGSMSNNYRGAMDQLICLAMFCRRVGIPHRIYGFTQCATSDFERGERGVDHPRRQAKHKLRARVSSRLADKNFVFPDMGFDLLEFFHEDMSLKDFNTMVGTLLMSAKRYENDPDEKTEGSRPGVFIDTAFGLGWSGALQFLGLGGTPLNDAILVSRDLLAKFRKEKNVQIMNFVCITDGESNYSSCQFSRHGGHQQNQFPHSSDRWSSYIFVDEESRIQTMINFDSSHHITAMFARTVRKSQNANFVGFYIVGGAYDVRHVSYRYLSTAECIAFQEKWKKKKDGAVIPNMLNFDEFYIIQGGRNLQSQQAKFDAVQDLKKGQLARAFISSQNKRGASRAILGKFIEKIAA